MKYYVAGFAFNPKGTHVAMVLKNKPDWQKGKLNAIGGKVESEENPGIAMVREFLEEAGVGTTHSQWKRLVTLFNEEHMIFFYYTFLSEDQWKHVRTVEEEEILKLHVSEIASHKRIDNIDMLLDMIRYKERSGFRFT